MEKNARTPGMWCSHGQKVPIPLKTNNLAVCMKRNYKLLISVVFILVASASLCFLRGVDTVPISLAWQRNIKIVYFDLEMESPARLSDRDVLAATLPGLHVMYPKLAGKNGARLSGFTNIAAVGFARPSCVLHAS